MSDNLSGGCACGAVQYNIEGPVKLVVNCHCQGCRRRNGASFSTYCVVPQSSFTVERGQDHIGVYGANEVGNKHFCKQCGSPLYNFNNRYPDMFMVYYGGVEAHTELTPRFNIYCESKLPWINGIAEIRSFEQAMQRR